MNPEALAAMLPYFGRDFANPSSSHSEGRKAAAAVEKARATVAACLGSGPDEIVFTSSGSEANNLAIKGAAALRGCGNIITAGVEHPSVLGACDSLLGAGFTLTRVQVDRAGLVDPSDLADLLRPETFLVSIMYANNETGTIMPVAEIGRICRAKGVLFHTDAVQAAGKIPVETAECKADLLSISAHKFNGPKGVGALFVRRGVRLAPIVHGGGQEKGLVAGTSDTAGIVAMAKALALRAAGMSEIFDRTKKLRDRLEEILFSSLDRLRLNGHPDLRLPNTLNVGIEGVDGGRLLEALDSRGVMVSGGAACHSGGRSPVLEAMGVYDEAPAAAIRFSLGPETAQEEVDSAAAAVVEEVRRLRGGKQ